MARHFAPTPKKKIKLPQLPSFRTPALPKLFPRVKRSYAPRRYARSFSVREMVLVILATLLFMASILLPLPKAILVCIQAVASILALLPLLFSDLQNLLQKKIPEDDLLVLLGVIGAFCIGEGTGGTIAAILYRMTQILEGYALARADAGFDLLRDKLADKARLVIGDQLHEVMPETVDPGQIVRVMPGETVPLDGRIVSGVTELDVSSLTGNNALRSAGVGSEVFSGSVNRGGAIDLEITRPFNQGAAALLLHDVEEAAQYESTPERWTDRVAAWYAFGVGVAALLLFLIPSLISGQWLRFLKSAVLFLLLASPSTPVIAISLSCFGGELSGVLHGILSKGHDCFEILAQTKTMVFGKTGTITEGRFTITEVRSNGVKREDLISVAAAAESYSHHPIAQLLKTAAGWTPEMAASVMQVEEIPGRGVSAFLEGKHVYVGNASLLQEHEIPFQVPARAGAAIHVAVENRYWGHILISDKTREGAFDALEALRSQGVDQLVMLTGDVLSASRPLAASLGFDLMRTELSPKDKVSAIRYLISGAGKGCSVGFVGDGINDVPMLEAADVGIAIDALEAWSESDSADILLLDDKIELLPQAMGIAKTLRRILWENLSFWGASRLILLILAVAGTISIPLTAVLSAVSCAVVLINSLRSFALK